MIQKLQNLGLDGRKLYFVVLLTGMAASVVTFNMDMELVSAGVIMVAVVLLSLIKRISERPVFDERDIDLAEESTHAAVMWTGVIGGVGMIVVSIGMGLGYWDYPYWAAPYYLTWGGIVGFAVIIEILKRYRLIE